MSSVREPLQPEAPRSSHVVSVVALALGIVLAVGVSALFGLIGWGGELASQTAGAASGAAPLLIDGIRQRRSRPKARAGPRALTAGLLRRYNKLWLASAFGFAVVLLNAAVGLLVGRLARWTIRAADGDPARFWPVYNVIGVVLILPVVLSGTYLLAVAAGHRLGERNRRWVLLGIGIYVVVSAGMLIVGGAPSELGQPIGVFVASTLLTAALMAWVALLGARRARKTQAAFYAQLYFRRLSADNQEAALLLLDETVSQPPPSPPPPATPPGAAPSSAGGQLEPGRAAQR